MYERFMVLLQHHGYLSIVVFDRLLETVLLGLPIKMTREPRTHVKVVHKRD